VNIMENKLTQILSGVKKFVVHLFRQRKSELWQWGEITYC